MKDYRIKPIALLLIVFSIVLSTGCDKNPISTAELDIESTEVQKGLNIEDKLTQEVINILKEHGINPDSIEYKGLSDEDFYLVGNEAWERVLKDRDIELKPLERKSDSLSYRYPKEEEHLFRASATPAQAEFTVIELSNPPASGSISVHYEGVMVTTQYTSGCNPLGVAMTIRNNINNNPNIQLTAGGPVGPTVVLTEKRAGCEHNGKKVYITSSVGSHICVSHASVNMSGGTDDGVGCPPYVPEVPQLKLPHNGANNQPVDNLWLEWFPSEGATSYHFQIATNTNFNNPGLDVSGYTPTGAWIDGLSFGTTYYWRVRAYNANGYSAWSSTRSFSTIPPLALGSGSFINPYSMPGYVTMGSYTTANYPIDFIAVTGVSLRDGNILFMGNDHGFNSQNASVVTMIRRHPWETPSNWSQQGSHEWHIGTLIIGGYSYAYLNH